MWGREKSLASRLAAADPAENPKRFSWLRKLGMPAIASQVREQGLGVESRVTSIDDVFMGQADVVDGLGPFSEHFEIGRMPGHREYGWSEAMAEGDRTSTGYLDDNSSPGEEGSDSPGIIRQIEMIPLGLVQRLAMPTPHRTTIRQGHLMTMPGARSTAVALGPVMVHALESFRDRPTEIMDGNRLLISPLAVHTFQKISKLIYRRRSIDLQSLNETEQWSFLQEAEALKHIPADRAELLGVFRSVPIEMISRLQFVSSRNEIVYGLVSTPGRSTTRVHDMAAVRDTGTREVHLVPHRTRVRSVNLGLARNGER